MPSVEILATAFLTVMVVASFISLRAKVPYTLVLVFLGIALAFASVVPLLGQGPIQSALQSVILQMRSLYVQLVQGQGGGLFVGLVVPPLLFEAMLHVRSTDLRSVIKPAFALATLGVVISTVVAGFILWRVAGLSIGVSFLFAALISPTDVATVLEIFRRARVPSRLAALMDTEAAFNDATGIITFTVVLASISFNRVSIFSAATGFVLVFAGGVLIGLLVAFVAEVLGTLISDRLTETVLTISAVYGSYALASSLGASGLIAVTVVGLYFGNITLKSTMSPATRDAVRLFWEFAAFLGNSVAFLFIGFQTTIFKLAAAVVPILLAYLAITVARAASVFPILTILDRVDEKIPLRWRNVSMLGGMRGALSIALAASIPLTLISSSDSETISTLVLGVAFISIIVQAALLSRYIRGRFPEEQVAVVESLNVKLSRVATSIETLHKMRQEGKISEEEYSKQFENEREELRVVLKELQSAEEPKNIPRERASELSAIFTHPTSKAREAFGLNRSKKQNSKLDESKQQTNPKNEDKEK